MGETVCWDGKPETVERLREVMPDCLEVWFRDYLCVTGLKQIALDGAVHDTKVVPFGWYLTRKECKNGAHAVLKPPPARGDR